ATLAYRADLAPVRPHIYLRRLEAVPAEDGADVRAMVAAVVGELRDHRPGLHLAGRPARIGHPAVRLELLYREQRFDRVLHGREVAGDLIERCVALLAERRIGPRDAEPQQVALVRGDDVRERAADRPVRSGGREVERRLRLRPHERDELLGRPDVVPELPEHRWCRHRASLRAPSCIASGRTCRSGGSMPCAVRVVAICERWSLPWCTNWVAGTHAFISKRCWSGRRSGVSVISRPPSSSPRANSCSTPSFACARWVAISSSATSSSQRNGGSCRTFPRNRTRYPSSDATMCASVVRTEPYVPGTVRSSCSPRSPRPSATSCSVAHTSWRICRSMTGPLVCPCP